MLKTTLNSTITATSAYSILQHNTTLLYFTSSDRNLRDTDSAYLAAQIVPLPPRFSLHRVNCTANHTICGNLMRSENTPRLVLYHAGWHVQDLTAQAALLSTSLKQAVRVVSKCRYAQWKHRRTIVLDPAKHDGFVLDEPSFRVAIRAETARRASLPGDAAAWEGGITWDAWSRMWLVGGVVMGLGVLVAFFVLFRRMRWRVKYLVVGGRKRGL
ncbi:hypothetical protein BC830DRAFT_87396 [Chytriomyces sp. MP71]|nr:hypothetical protein BC830DRAFT_87396 [Chytriomyces sp. MP71]